MAGHQCREEDMNAAHDVLRNHLALRVVPVEVETLENA